MNAQESIQQCFFKLVLLMPYKSITITTICKEANVSRASFYDFFPNKEAVLASIVEEDLIVPAKQLRQIIPTTRIKSAPQILGELVYQNISKHADFYKAVNKVDEGILLIKTITNGLASFNKTVLEDYELSDDEKWYTSYFFASSNAILISKWLDRGLDINPSQLGKWYNRWTQPYWQSATPFKTDWMEP